tara:strand:+ start:1024 stop:1575 length:552 start_codon:yes stop_codon:yes gene_type:complete
MIKDKAVKRKAVFVDTQSFAKSLEVYSKKVTAMQNIKKEVRRLIPSAHLDQKFFNNVMKNFYEILLAKYNKENTLNLRGEKLADLLELNLNNLKKYSDIYDEVKNIKSPTEDTFTTYAETDAELNKLDLCERLIEMINDIEQEAGVKAYPFDLVKAFKNIITFDIRKNTYAPNYKWIKEMKQY